MRWIISKSRIKGYFLIYFMILVNQTILYESTLRPYNLVIFVSLCLFCLLHQDISSNKAIWLIAFLLLSVISVRLRVGGIGIDVWLDWGIKILITYIAVKYNNGNFLTRFLNLILVIVVFSIFGFFSEIINPNIWRSITPFTTQSLFGNKLSGMFLYVSGDLQRNRSLFTEPGIFQMVINTALFILIFWDKYIDWNIKKKKIAVIFFLVALASCQSTTGYISGLAIILFSILSKENKSPVKRTFIFLVITALIVQLYDYYVNGTNSFLYSVALFKIEETNFSLEAPTTNTTGNARLGTIILCVTSMLEHPLGIGIDGVSALLNTTETGFLAAQIMQDGASLGVIPFFVILFSIFSPVLRAKIPIAQKIVIIFLYVNTALAQSSSYYPMLILFSILFYINNGEISNERKIAST